MSQKHGFTDEQASMHVHDHTGITSCNEGHCHIHPGVTGPPIPTGTNHYHEIIGATTYDHGHYHVYRAFTELAVHLPDGQHTHFASFRTSFNFGHDHMITGYVKPTMGKRQHPTPYEQQPDK